MAEVPCTETLDQCIHRLGEFSSAYPFLDAYARHYIIVDPVSAPLVEKFSEIFSAW
jgi:hypothetical protein